MTDQNTFDIAELQQKANEGNAQAQFDLALCYRNGTNIERNQDLASIWLTKSAEQGLSRAQLEMGVKCSLVLLGKSIEMQIILWKIFINLFNDRFDLYFFDHENADAGLGFKWFTKAAQQNCVEAQFYLACCYYEGIGTSLNNQLAFEWFKKAAEQGYASAQFIVARCYFEGRGVELNDGFACEWLKKSAEQDLAEAQRCLAFCYLDGQGVEQNALIAVEWLTKSAENNNRGNSRLDTAEACLLLAELYDHGSVVEQNKDLALKWEEKGENFFIAYGSEENQEKIQLEFTETWSKVYCRLARFYLKDKCAANYNFALGMEYKYRLKALETGHTFAEDWSEDHYQLALCYFDGKGVEKCYEHGLKWLIRAVRANHAEAWQWLENTYLNFVFPYFSEREDIDQCHEFAFKWLLSDHEKSPDDFEINFGLGVLYAFGKGIEKNQELAVKHFLKCMGGCNVACGNPNIETFTEIFYDFSELFKDISDGTINHYYFSCLAPFFIEKSHLDNVANKSYAVLPLLKFDFHIERGEFDLLKAFLNDFENFESSFITDYAKKCFKIMGVTAVGQTEALAQKNKELEEANHRMQKLVEQFTHTLGNVIFPDTIYQVAERLKANPECRKDVLLLNEAYHSEIIIKLQAELLRRRHTNDNPKGFRDLIRSCRRKTESTDRIKSIGDILRYAASRVTARFLNQHNASLGSIRDKILAQKNVSLDTLRQQFEDDILLNKTLGSVEWINQYLRPFEVVALSPLWRKVYFLAESHAEALLFGYFSEVLFNAFKYADHDAEKFLTVRFDETVIDGKPYLSCSWSNPQGSKTPNSLGTGKGLDAILEDLQQLNDTDSDTKSLLVTQDDQQFKVTMFFQKDLLIDEVSMPNFKRKTKTE